MRPPGRPPALALSQVRASVSIGRVRLRAWEEQPGAVWLCKGTSQDSGFCQAEAFAFFALKAAVARLEPRAVLTLSGRRVGAVKTLGAKILQCENVADLQNMPNTLL